MRKLSFEETLFEPSFLSISESIETSPIHNSFFLLQKCLKFFNSFAICLQAEMQPQLISLNENLTTACKIL